MTAPNAILNGGCCCSSPTDCHGIPQSPACLWAGPVLSASALSFLYDIDFRSTDVQLPAIVNNAGTHTLVELSPTDAAAREYVGSPMTLYIKSSYCCDPDETKTINRPVSLISGKIAPDSIPDLSGKYVIVYLEVLECPDPAAPLPHVLASSPGLPTYRRPANCGTGGCLDLEEDAIPLSTVGTLRELLPEKRGELSVCGWLLLYYQRPGLAGICDPELWHLAASDGAKLPNSNTAYNSKSVKICFGNDKKLADLSALDAEQTINSVVTKPFAGVYRRCSLPQTPTKNQWVARKGFYPFYTGYTLSNPTLISQANIEEVHRTGGAAPFPVIGYQVIRPCVSFDVRFVPKLEIPYLMSAFGGENQNLYGATWKFEDMAFPTGIWDGVGKGNDDVIVEKVSPDFDSDSLLTSHTENTPGGETVHWTGPELSGNVALSDGIATVILSANDQTKISRTRKIITELWFRGTFIDDPEILAYHWKTGENEYGEPKYEDGYYSPDRTGWPLDQCLARAETVCGLLNAGISGAISSIMAYSAASNGANTWEDADNTFLIGVPFNSCGGDSPQIELNACGFWNN